MVVEGGGVVVVGDSGWWWWAAVSPLRCRMSPYVPAGVCHQSRAENLVTHKKTNSRIIPISINAHKRCSN